MARRRLHRIEPADLRLLFEATLLVAAIRVGLALVTVRTLRRGLAAAVRCPGSRPAADAAARIGWAVTAASARLPGATCLTRALAAEVLLRRRRLPARLQIAITRHGARGFEGHAWVESDGRIVVGGAQLAGYVPLTGLETERP